MAHRSGGIRLLVSASVGRSGLSGREYRLLFRTLSRLVGEGVKNSDDGAVGGQNSNGQHGNHSETQDANA
jgi:hypothetical protein